MRRRESNAVLNISKGGATQVPFTCGIILEKEREMREGIRKVYPVTARFWHFDTAMERGWKGWIALSSYQKHDLNAAFVH